MWAYLIFYLFPLAVQGYVCKEGWSYFNDFCYKHFYDVNDRLNVAEASQRCVSYGGILTPVSDDATVEFLGNLTKMPGHGRFGWLDQPIVGIRRDVATVSAWYNENDRSKSPPLGKFFYPYGNGNVDRCVLLNVDKVVHAWAFVESPPPCLVPTQCQFKFSRYICRIPKNSEECTTQHMEKVNGNCVCERGYVDATETKDSDAKKYKKGEKCTPLETPSPSSQCPREWSSYSGFCYKHFYDVNDRVTVSEAGQKCKQQGAILTPVSDDSTLAFLGSMAKMPGNGWYGWYEQPIVGIRRDVETEAGWYNENDRSRPPSCNSYNYGPVYMCVLLNVENSYYNGEFAYAPTPRLMPTQCSYKFSRYICRKDKGHYVECNKPHTESVNGKCVCKTGYIDITETDVPERKKYQQGEKCINQDPCREADDLTVTFIVDSSESIGAKNWDSLVEFLRSGAKFLPNTTRVGFVKYSDNITFADFLPAGWNEKKFRNFVPSTYDNAGTNTPDGLDKARKMLDKDSSKNKVAILITDGLPFVDGLEQDEVLKKTEKAAEKLRSKGINLIALGYGESLYKSSGYQYIEKWLEDPEEDYFGYDKLACDFKQMHMSILMRKVCRDMSETINQCVINNIVLFSLISPHHGHLT